MNIPQCQSASPPHAQPTAKRDENNEPKPDEKLYCLVSSLSSSSSSSYQHHHSSPTSFSHRRRPSNNTQLHPLLPAPPYQWHTQASAMSSPGAAGSSAWRTGKQPGVTPRSYDVDASQRKATHGVGSVVFTRGHTCGMRPGTAANLILSLAFCSSTSFWTSSANSSALSLEANCLVCDDREV